MVVALLLALVSLIAHSQVPVEADEIDIRQKALENPDLLGGDMLIPYYTNLGNAINDESYRWPDYPGGAPIPYAIDRSLARARQALHGEKGDIRYHEEDHRLQAGMSDTKSRWPGYPGAGIVPYVLDEDVQTDEKLVKLIEDAMKQYENNTCIRFVKRKDEENYIEFIKDEGCYSYFGVEKRVEQPQPVSLGYGCEYIGTVVHELGHAIGLYHEHQRSDRDTYITVYPQNVRLGKFHNFDKTDPSKELKFTPYDYTSIMHYGEYAFSKWPGNLKTMVAKDGKTELKEPYERPGLNKNDIDLVNKLYKCE